MVEFFFLSFSQNIFHVSLGFIDVWLFIIFVSSAHCFVLIFVHCIFNCNSVILSYYLCLWSDFFEMQGWFVCASYAVFALAFFYSFFLSSTPQDSFSFALHFLLFFSNCDKSRVCSKHRLISYWTNDASFFFIKMVSSLLLIARFRFLRIFGKWMKKWE